MATAGLQLKTGARLGPVPWTNIASSPAVGAYDIAPRLAFNPPKAEARSILTITFKTHAPLSAGDRILVRLPDFFALDAVVVASPTAALCPAPLWNATQSSLLIEMCGAFSTAQIFSATVTNLRLPVDGISPGITSLTVTLNSTLGDIPESSFVDVQPVGAIHAELSFPGSAKAGQLPHEIAN